MRHAFALATTLASCGVLLLAPEADARAKPKAAVSTKKTGKKPGSPKQVIAPKVEEVPVAIAPGTGNEPAPGEAMLEAWVDQADLPAMRKRGVLRVLDENAEESFLPREGRAASSNRDLIREFARRQGLQLQFVDGDGLSGLFRMLVEGRGDVIAEDLTITDDRKDVFAFTRPITSSVETVVGRKGGPAPASLAEVTEVHVRAASSFAKTLAAAKEAQHLGLRIVSLPDDIDPEEAAYEVTAGKLPLTVIDSHVLQRMKGYNDQLVDLFPISEPRPIAWALRKGNPELKSALDSFLVETFLTQHAQERSTDDLDFMRKRGSLRVITRNNPVTYFLYRGQRMGFDYELAQQAAEEAGLRLEMVIAPSRDQLIPWLNEGRGDLIAASLSVTPDREKDVAFTAPYLFVNESIVERRNGPRIRTLADLKGKKIHVRRSSSYRRTLDALQADFGPFTIVDVPEDVETEEIIKRLSKKQLDFTVADSHILQVELSYRPDIEAGLKLPPAAARSSGAGEGRDDTGQPIAFAVRRNNPKLKALLDTWVSKNYRGMRYNMARSKYFENKRNIVTAHEGVSRPGEISAYDKLIKKYSQMYGFDWRLMASQAFQESKFDPRAKSWVGAQGLFQVMPTTGKSMGFTKLEDPAQGAHAGIQYMFKLMQQIDPKIPLKHRLRFALAAYNAGLGHVLDAQRIAAEKKLDPTRWFGNVEKAMLLLQEPSFAAKARHGYCRGEEPVKYVSEIQNRYDNYVKVVPE